MLGFAYKRFDGKVPEYDTLTAADRAIIEQAEKAFDEVGGLLAQVKLREALLAAMEVVREANAYLNEREPWKTVKSDPADAARAVYAILRVIDNLKILLAPFLPFSSQQLHEYLGYDGQLFGDLNIETFSESTRDHQALVYDPAKATGTWAKSDLKPGHALREPKALFVKLDPEIIDQERAYLGASRDEHEIKVEG
jgi:methionyl-tRNA synthetase